MNHLIKCLVITVIAFWSCECYPQRKDSDAKISHSNYVRSATGQRKTVSEANVRIRYALNPGDLKDKSTWIDEGQLKIARDMTDYSSYFVEVNEDSLANWFDTHGRGVAYPPARWIQGHRPDYWIEYQYSNIVVKNNILTEYATMPRAIESDNLKYSETYPLQQWEITDETDEICGYSCQMAICNWRGREYTAWFTPDIPVSSGPWKFGGLPGLIMKIADSTNTYSWEATEVKNGIFPIYEPRGSKYKESTREKVQELQRKLNENYFKTTGTEVIQYKTGKIINSRKHPYSQLELE